MTSKELMEKLDDMDIWINGETPDPADPAKKIKIRRGICLHFSTTKNKWKAGYGRSLGHNSPEGNTIEEALQALRKRLE